MGGPVQSADVRINMMRTMEGRSVCEDMKKQAIEVKEAIRDGKIKIIDIYVDPNNQTTVVKLDKKADGDKVTALLEKKGYEQQTDGGSGTTYYRSDQFPQYRVQLGFADHRDGRAALA